MMDKIVNSLVFGILIWGLTITLFAESNPPHLVAITPFKDHSRDLISLTQDGSSTLTTLGRYGVIFGKDEASLVLLTYRYTNGIRLIRIDRSSGKITHDFIITNMDVHGRHRSIENFFAVDSDEQTAFISTSRFDIVNNKTNEHFVISEVNWATQKLTPHNDIEFLPWSLNGAPHGFVATLASYEVSPPQLKILRYDARTRTLTHTYLPAYEGGVPGAGVVSIPEEGIFLHYKQSLLNLSDPALKQMNSAPLNIGPGAEDIIAAPKAGLVCVGYDVYRYLGSNDVSHYAIYSSRTHQLIASNVTCHSPELTLNWTDGLSNFYFTDGSTIQATKLTASNTIELHTCLTNVPLHLALVDAE